MEKLYFSKYSDLGYIPGVGRVAGINEPGYVNLSRSSGVSLHSNASLQKSEHYFKYMASTTGKSIYYQKLLEVQKELRENAAAIAEVTAKYPYDGKSTFTELLRKESRKISNK